MAKKHIDWGQIASTPLTRELASHRDPQMPITLASKRIYYALHEAAHLLTAARYNVPVHTVTLIDHRGQFAYLNEPGPCAGSVRTFYTADTPNAAVAFAGCEYESIYCKTDTNIAAVEDLTAGLQTLCEATRSPFGGVLYGAEEGALQPEARRIRQEVRSLLIEKWALIDACATAFLLFTNTKGELDGRKTGELIAHIRADGRLPMACRSRNPDQLHASLGVDITTHWRSFVCIDAADKFDARAKQISARHPLGYRRLMALKQVEIYASKIS